MLERLIESWMDSVNERSFQSPFCQMLAAQGHTILHSTRHSASEAGKDVVSIDAAGNLCAYQLKGKPGGRFGVSDHQQHIAQIQQLIVEPICLPGRPPSRHKAYLVTNGLVEEEVRESLVRMNTLLGEGRSGAVSLEVIERGTLVRWACDLGAALWPSELANVNKLLSMLVADGRALDPSEELDQLLQPVLLLDEPLGKVSAARLRRAAFAGAILTAVAMRSFGGAKNHAATAFSWTMFCAYSIAAAKRHGLRFRDTVQPAVDIASEAVFDSLAGLAEELVADRSMIAHGSLAEPLVYHARKVLLAALMSVYWYWSEERGWSSTTPKGDVESFVLEQTKEQQMWGEGAIPQILLGLWCRRRIDPTFLPEVLVAQLLFQVIRRSSPGSPDPLYSPYYSFQEILRDVHADALHLPERPLKNEATGGGSFLLESVMHVAVRHNLKRTCKAGWPEYTKLSSRKFEPQETWQYCLRRTEEGNEYTTLTQRRGTWSRLVEEAYAVRRNFAPMALLERPLLLAMFVILFPHRATPAAMRSLAQSLDYSWLPEGCGGAG